MSNDDATEEGFYDFEGCGADGCNWKKAMRAALAIARAAPNFASFVAPGSTHVVTESDAMYGKKAQGIVLSDWLRDMLAGKSVQMNVDCKAGGTCS